MSVETRIKRGIAWLDKEEPGWADKIDISAFDISDGEYCVLGQVFGGFGEYVEDVGMSWTKSCNLGFNVASVLHRSQIGGAIEEELLNTLWIEQIRARQTKP